MSPVNYSGSPSCKSIRKPICFCCIRVLLLLRQINLKPGKNELNFNEDLDLAIGELIFNLYSPFNRPK